MTPMTTHRRGSLPLPKDSNDDMKLRAQRVTEELRFLGAVRYDLWLPESHSLPLFIHAHEHIVGVVYGRYVYEDVSHSIVGRGALVATDERVLLIDRKPFFVHCDEIPYKNVSGITYGRVGPMGTIRLLTKIGTITLRTFNRTCSRSFVEAIEANIFNDQEGDAI